MSGDNDARIVERIIQERSIGRGGTDKVMVGLVNQNHDIRGKLADERLHVLAGS